MSPEQWEKIKDIADAASGLDPAKRAEFIRLMAAGDSLVLREAESLVSAAAERGFTDLLSPVRPGYLVDGKYRLEHLLQSGGFGDAWLATDQSLNNRKVVVKVLKSVPDMSAEATYKKEVEAISRIDHPGVVQPVAAGRLPTKQPYIVMQYVSGRSLRQLIAEGPLAPVRVGHLVQKIGSAIEAAHAQGVSHCDIKPENILVQTLDDGTEEPRVIDFGIARIRQSTTEWKTTKHVVGSLRYMAPEQLQGQATEATDTFGIAVVSYEMLTGQVPFPAADVTQLIRMHQAGPTPARRLQRQLSVEADKLIAKALAEDPEARPSPTIAFTSALALALEPVPERVAPKASRNASAVVAVLIAGVAILFLAYRSATAPAHDAVPTLATQTVAAADRLHVRIITKLSGAAAQPDGDVLIVGEAFRLELTAVESGYLYMFSEDREVRQTMTVLFPSPTANNGSSYLESKHQIVAPEGWFELDSTRPQRLWVVWARSPVPEFESAGRWANPTDRGAIADAGSRIRIRSQLSLAAQAPFENPIGTIRSVAAVVAVPVDLQMHR
jgi:hypothetical protein